MQNGEDDEYDSAETDCEIARKTLPAFGPALHRAASNVVKLKKRQ
jgi:hypothetical protein